MIAFAACRLFAGNAALSLEVAFLLRPASFAFVVIQTALIGGGLNAQAATLASTVVGLSMLVAAMLARLGRLAAGSMQQRPQAASDMADFAALSGRVVIVGHGCLGRTIARILKVEGARSWRRSPEVVAREREKGWGFILATPRGRSSSSRRCGRKPVCRHRRRFGRCGADGARSARAAPRCPGPCAGGILPMRDNFPMPGRASSFPMRSRPGLQLPPSALAEYGYAGETIRDRIAAERQYRRDADDVDIASS